MSIPVYRNYSDKEGQEWSAEAFAHMAREERAGRCVSYRESLQHVMSEASQRLRRQYEQAGDWADVGAMNADKVGAEAYRDIGNFVRGLGQSNGRFDSTKAAEAVNNFFDGPVIFAAVSHVIGVRQDQIWKNMPPGATNQNLRVALRQSLSEQQPVASIYNGSIDDAAMTAEALIIMYPSNRWV